MRKYLSFALAALLAGCAARQAANIYKTEDFSQTRSAHTTGYLYNMEDTVASRMIIREETPQTIIHFEVDGIKTAKNYVDLKSNGMGLDFAHFAGSGPETVYIAGDINPDMALIMDMIGTNAARKILPRNSAEFKGLQEQENTLKKEIDRLNRQRNIPPYPR